MCIPACVYLPMYTCQYLYNWQFMHTKTSSFDVTFVPVPCSVLRAALPERGFTAHVMGYTAHAVLDALVKKGAGPGDVDDSVPLMVPLIEADLFGDVSAEILV